ncbi:hypothetical protein C2S52_013260 [Perilla frutescens var. hirtella]|nr:hypothetical protein C2S52_013260 [Perilla frutescens var. hirtella]
MTPVFGTVQMLKPGKGNFELELRLIRYYENTNSYNMECIFHDREGTRVHVIIPRANVEKFKHCLIEGNVYALINFVIGINVMKYKTTASLYKIIIFNQTRLFEVFHDDFPHRLYEIKSFVDVANMEHLGDAPMFDVIGTIVSHYRPLTRDINGKLTKLMDLVLEDIEGNTITATLWEDYADDMIEFLNSAPKAPVVIILQFCRPNVHKGEIRISSLFNVTKIVTKQSISELSDFCSSYLSTGKLRSTTISTLTSSLSRSLNDEIRDGEFMLKTISELMTDGEVGNYWVFATILCVETIGDWSYLACKRYHKKMRPSGNRFFCEKCQTFDITGKLRYKLTVRVVDDIGTTTFLLWDKESIALIGKSASELSVPGHTRNYTGSFSVARISIDREIVLKVCGEYVMIEDEASTSINGAEMMEEMIGSSSSKSVLQSGSAEVISKTIQQMLEDGQELDPQDTLKFFCEPCQSFDICGKSRYKLTVGVSDGTTSTTFLLWENQCMELLGENSAEDEMLDLLPPKVEGITTKKGLFKVIVLPKQVKNFMGPFSVVKVECEKSVVGATPQNQESSSKSKKGKEVIDKIADEEILIRDSLVTPKKTTNAVTILDDESVKRRLLDEFAAKTHKRTKRIVKMEKM